MFFKSKASAGGVEAIVVGLGNPGRQYEGTRHNIGWRALDAAAEAWGGKIVKSKHKALTDTVTVNGKKVLLMKPQTFMNASGEAVGDAAKFYKVAPQNVIVLSDDIALAPGVLRIRKTGSAGGHNGLKSIIAHLGSQDFLRLRIGVGEKPHPEYDLADWVLGKFSPADNKAIDERMADIVAALELMLAGEPDKAISKYNGAKK
ncbi:MAG: aminoacyl-tRNA hydrolase [Oscillospiraceae bacterium]|nr:aminoacyl-tRNA hydrolase [Oscillospiraceae bacterium]